MFPSIFQRNTNAVVLTKQERIQMWLEILAVGFLAGLFILLFVCPSLAGGNADANGGLAVKAVVSIVCRIARVVGIIFIIVGAVKFAISHANEQGAEQQKSIMMMATGIVLVVIPTIIIAIQDKLTPIITQDDNNLG